MKKLILFFMMPVVALLADFTLTGQTLTPLNEDVTSTPTTSSTPTTYTANTSTIGSAKTNWGFQPFAVPSKSITVPVGGDIQAAIDSLPNGGTVYLKEGIYTTKALDFKGKHNIVMEGAGIGKTILKAVTGADKHIVFTHCNGLASWDKNSPCVENIILRNFEIDGENHAAGGITFAWGVANLLIDNIDVHNIDGSGIIINNNTFKYKGKNITLENLYVHDNNMHGIGVRFTKGVVVDNYKAHDLKMGVDYSSVLYGEVSNTTVERALWGGMKFPSNDHLYIHDVKIKDCHVLGIKMQEGTKYPPLSPQNIQLENVTVENSGPGISWVGIKTKFPIPVTTMIISGIKLINNRESWDNVTNQPITPYGPVITHIRMNIKIQDLYEFGDNIGIADTHPLHYHKYSTGTPEKYGIGWKSWPKIK